MKKLNFNNGWKFSRGSGDALSSLTGAPYVPPLEVTLPYDGSITTERDLEETSGSGNGFFREENYVYTKTFFLDKKDADKNIYLEFEGVYQNSFIYVNGSFAGQCPYGYSNFYIDMTKFLIFESDNTVKVSVKNGLSSGRWYTGGGIYRNVNLMLANRLHFEADGVQVTAVTVEKQRAVIRAASNIVYTGIGMRNVAMHMQLKDAKGNVVAKDKIPISVEEHSQQVYRQKLYVENPILWDDENPYLYTYYAFIEENGNVIDSEEGTFGIRNIQLDPIQGLRVNGKTVKLRGGCIHHDNGIIGAAEFSHAARERVRKLKQAGYNAIRSAHYPMSRQLLNACDEYGMYVMDEYSDVWTTTKVDFDYGIHMTQWWEQDVENMIKKDYNHPCVIMYSIGNEIPEVSNQFDVQWGKKITDKIRSLDDSRYITNCINSLLSVLDHLPELMGANDIVGEGMPMEINSMMDNMRESMEQIVTSDFVSDALEEACGQVDITGYNYGTVRYKLDKTKYPNRIIVGSESNGPELDEIWGFVEEMPNVIGDFSWTAWDYLGETGIGKVTYGEAQSKAEKSMNFYSPYPTKAAYCGDFNLIGDRRPISYWREIIWGLRSAPYLCVQPPKYHNIPHNMTQWALTNAVKSWSWAGFENKPITIEVYSDAEELELIVNGKVIERKAVGIDKKAITHFETIYEPGKVETVAYKNGIETGRDMIVTAGNEELIFATPDREVIPADGSDIAYVNIFLLDNNGICNMFKEKEIFIHIQGPGLLQGLGSANPESAENYFDTSVKFFEGRALAAVRGNGESGTVTLTVSADDCEDMIVQIQTV